jgi:hypothetical protein
MTTANDPPIQLDSESGSKRPKSPQITKTRVRTNREARYRFDEPDEKLLRDLQEKWACAPGTSAVDGLASCAQAPDIPPDPPVNVETFLSSAPMTEIEPSVRNTGIVEYSFLNTRSSDVPFAIFQRHTHGTSIHPQPISA